jgi:argininosuccinate lyase
MGVKPKKNVMQELPNSNDNVVSSIAKEALATPLWGGHFSKGANKFTQKLVATLGQDRRYYSVAIESLKAQMRMVFKRNVVAEAEGRVVIEVLDKLKKEIVDGKFVFDEGKDIYECIYNKLKKANEKAAQWLNVARSSSNQVAGDLKLWVRDAYDTLDSSLQNLQAALIDKAEENVKTLFPGYSNNQLVQPISFGHFLMAFVEMFGRDRSRIKDARKRMNESPFVAGEIAGNSFNVSREMVARSLGFDKASSNSIDAIASRDFVVEFLSFAATSSMHLSRIAEEMLRWHNSQNNYIAFSNEFVTQSQVVPYKRDPEAVEMIRGKASKIYGALVCVLTTLKALPVQFSSDLKDLSEPVFESYDTLLNAVNAMSALIADFKINRKQMKEAASHSYSTAIDLVDWLIQNIGYTPEKAQEKSRQIIEYSINKGKKLSLLDLKELKAIEPKITDNIYSVLIPSRALISRRSGSGSNPVQIRKIIRAARRNYL